MPAVSFCLLLTSGFPPITPEPGTLCFCACLPPDWELLGGRVSPHAVELNPSALCLSSRASSHSCPRPPTILYPRLSGLGRSLGALQSLLLIVRQCMLLWPKVCFFGPCSEEWAVLSVPGTALLFLTADAALPWTLLCPHLGSGEHAASQSAPLCVSPASRWGHHFHPGPASKQALTPSAGLPFSTEKGGGAVPLPMGRKWALTEYQLCTLLLLCQIL